MSSVFVPINRELLGIHVDAGTVSISTDKSNDGHNHWGESGNDHVGCTTAVAQAAAIAT